MEVEIIQKRCCARISAVVDGKEVGYLTYSIDNGTLDIEHTVVDPSMRGQGIARKMVEKCDAFCREEGLNIKASCSYAAKVLGIDCPNPSCRIN
ncbi:MAG: N-acetyltransferase [archaeon]|nr:N-acetyltransferase [archaeon]